MRLTLRTLLAYMDDVLDPAYHDELAKKIEGSDFAAELIHRSRDVVRRLRLGSPDILAGEDDDVLNPDPASDANTVAEYLDNMLPPERVAEFERACLDSGTVADMHLAEVTSCHHILTMILGEPADIDQPLRRRMYELPQQRLETGEKLRIEPAHQLKSEPQAAAPVNTPAVIAASASAVATETAVPKAAPTALPDYLRVAADGRRRRQTWMVAAVLAVLGGLTAYLLSGAFEEPVVPPDVAGMNSEDFEDLADIQIGEVTQSDAGESNASGTIEDSTVVAEESVSDPPLDAAPSQPLENAPAAIVGATEPTTETPESPAVNEQAAAADKPVTKTPVPETSDDAVIKSPTVDAPVAASVGPGPTTEKELATLPQETPTESLDPEAAVAAATTTTIEGDPLGIEGTGAENETPEQPAGPVKLGVYVGNSDVLLRLDPQTKEWLRLPSRTAISAGETLLTLPKYRTHVVLANLNAYLTGGTQISLPEQPDPEEMEQWQLVLELAYGQLLLNADASSCVLTLKAGSSVHQIHLDKASSLAVDVHRVFVPGTDYEKESAAVEVNWYLAEGTIEWTNSNGTKEVTRAPASWKTVNGTDTAPEASEMPLWLENESVSSLERRARDHFAQELEDNRPVGLRLQELNEEQTSNREMRTLSAESSLYVGEFEPFVKSLNDRDQRTQWRSHIAAMRQAMARDPQVASKLREAFVAVRGAEAGGDLMAMVRGFTPNQIGMTREELKQGVVMDLLRWLEDENLDYRVLAIYNLDEIKGTKDLKDYRPSGVPRSRNVAVTKIRQMIEDDEFLPLP